MVPLLRRLWTEDAVTHHGESFILDEVGIHPRPSRSIPMWMGGGGFESQGHPGEVSMRRAARLADGFKLMAPTGADVDRAIGSRTTSPASSPPREGRTIDIEARLLTQLTPPDEWASVVARYRESGAFTHIGLGNRIVGGTVHDQIALIREVERRVRSEL